jgi:hypothetical protein
MEMFIGLVINIIISIFELVIQIPLILIGETIIWILTLGKYKPYNNILNKSGYNVLISSLSFWIGLISVIMSIAIFKYFQVISYKTH